MLFDKQITSSLVQEINPHPNSNENIIMFHFVIVILSEHNDLLSKRMCCKNSLDIRNDYNVIQRNRIRKFLCFIYVATNDELKPTNQ